MKRSLMIFVFLCLVFLSPLFVMAESEPYGDDTCHEFPDWVDEDVSVELEWKDEGDLIYWYLDVSQTVRLYLVNSSIFNSKKWNYPIFSTQIEAGEAFTYNITLPYDDDAFYFRLENIGDTGSLIDGWYAKDETVPTGNMWGLNTNFADEVLIGSTRDITCVFSDYFDIVNMLLYENDVMVRTHYGPADTMIKWTISDYKFTTLGIIEVAFKAEDQGRNIGTVSKTVKVVNKLSSPPTTSKPEYFDWVGIFENYWFIIIPIGAVLGIAAMFGLEKAGILH